ncbi:ketoacyl-ACP synthase III [Helicobacter muridarum]|uniref:3-oxoacyl-ACP synthase n=1 Tax=Helicobacter muridarum TaxID=216 RepID=A0A099U0U5_9HELI|nr:3-oxoacyl-[acyl-carrier-protein] synthase III C-terminal domain-containing protein [Helicobacter muridarum]TLE00157.1 ketoacyl-ACP synthase III [Helicobacter muridarum]STQ87037.1 3-oxoacyl-ACP synthase [Helicobacter muridarum]
MNCEVSNAAIRHITTALPSLKMIGIDNPHFDIKTKKRIIKTTGVDTTYRLHRKFGQDDDETLLNLYIDCGLDTLSRLNWSKDSIDAIIVCSQKHEYKLPATACILQDKLDLPKEVAAYDISMGCSAYPYALFTAMSHINATNGKMKRILLFVGDSPSHEGYDKYRGSFLFSDAGSCTALEFSPNSKETYFRFKTMGDGFDCIIEPIGGLKNPFTKESFEPYYDEEGELVYPWHGKMDGIKVFEFAINEVPLNINEMLRYTNISIDKIDSFYLHQASKIIMDQLGAKIGITQKMPIHLRDFGNASCASIPLLMCDNKDGYKSESLSMFVTFGVGLSVSIALLQDMRFSTNLIYRHKKNE